MATYQYEAIASDGKQRKGNIEADNPAEASKKLKDSGMTPMLISEQSLLNKDINISFGKKKVTDRDFSVFCRQFASVLRAGVSIINALEMLSEQTENKTLKEALVKVTSNVEKGETLSASMKACKDVFPPLLVSMVSAGEASGSLEVAVDRMAIQFEKNSKLKSIVKKATTYPIMLCFVAVAVLVVMMVYVVPNFVSMFDELGSDLPFATKLVMGMSDFIIGYWYIIIVAVVAVVVLYKMYIKTPGGRYTVDSIKLKMPGFGVLNTKTACAQFSRTLSTLLKSGMPVMQALEITAGTMTNVLFKDALGKVRNGVGLGLSMSNQLKATKLFPSMVVHMIGIGEETGNTEEMLNNIADYYDDEVEIATQQLTTMMEPLIIVVMALIVGGIIMAVYGPMITLYNVMG